MLVMEAARRPDEGEKALRFAEEVMALRTSKPFLVTNLPIEVYTSTTLTAGSLSPDDLEVAFRRYAVTQDKRIVGMVDVVETTPSLIEAAGFTPYDVGSTTLEALRLADLSAKRDGPHGIRMIEIPPLSASFIWVTGEDPEFVDQHDCKVYREEDLVRELRRRLERKMPSPV